MLITTEDQYKTQAIGIQLARVDGKPGVYIRMANGNYRDTHNGREYTPTEMAGTPRERVNHP